MRQMRRALLIALTLGALLLLAAPAGADTYAGQPGDTPKAGSVDSVSPSGERGAPTQVLGQTFVRTENEDFLASTGADILEMTGFAVLLIGGGFVLVRRARHRTRPPATA